MNVYIVDVGPYRFRIFRCNTRRRRSGWTATVGVMPHYRSLGYIEHADGTQVIKPTFREVRDHIAYAYQGKKGRA